MTGKDDSRSKTGDEFDEHGFKRIFLPRELFLEIVHQQARERELTASEVREIVETSLARILHRNNDRKGEFRVRIDPTSGELHAWRIWKVIPDDQLIQNPDIEQTEEYARDTYADSIVDDEVVLPFAPPDLNRHTNALTFKQQFSFKIRDAERRKLLAELLERDERLLNGTVRRVDRVSGDVIIDSYRVECRLCRSDTIPKEMLRQGDRVRALIKEIVEEPNRGIQVYLTRAEDDFLRKLFEREVPEIEKGVLEIVSIARHPGYRSKVAVRSLDPKVDPVGTCVGIRGTRVQSVTADLAGERVDIVQWEEEEIDFVLRALAPAEVARFRITGERCCDVIVNEENLAQAIGKDGMNVRLASRLTGWQINITDSASSDKMEAERVDRKQEYFKEKLDVDESVATILYEEGFDGVEAIAEIERSELLAIEGFEEEIVEALLERSQEAVRKSEQEFQVKSAQADPALHELASEPEVLRSLIGGGIMTLQDLAEMAADELIEITDSLTEEEAEALIMKARSKAGWFADDEAVDG